MTADRVDVVVLNGGSSSGKSTIARHVQALLPDTWLTLGVDDLIDALPQSTLSAKQPAITFSADGGVLVGDSFRSVEAAWNLGIAAIAAAGTGVIVDDVFLSGGHSQARLRTAFAGLRVLWVGVRCDPEIAAAREAERGDRISGMARSQAVAVHAGVVYDLEVDTTHSSVQECARVVATRITAINPA
jgi:chloramphenicol 3-O phosphotransferase